jgi:ParB/RepB/Spo0J family partition protein
MTVASSNEVVLGRIAVVPERMRRLRPDVVNQLAESMSVCGLIEPIVVRLTSNNGYCLVAGRHRLEAAKQLKWPSIPAVVLNGANTDEALLVEIDENLIRADLTPAERALYIGRRKELYEKLHPETKHGARGRGRSKKSRQVGNSNNRFTKETAKLAGQSERKVQRDAARAKKVKVLADIAGTSLDKGDEIDALAKLPAQEQEALAVRAKSGEKVSAKKNGPSTVGPIQEGGKDFETAQQRWHRSVEKLAGDAVSMRTSWSREFGENWTAFKVTPELVTLTSQAAHAWTELKERLDLTIPKFLRRTAEIAP